MFHFVTLENMLKIEINEALIITKIKFLNKKCTTIGSYFVIIVDTCIKYVRAAIITQL